MPYHVVKIKSNPYGNKINLHVMEVPGTTTLCGKEYVLKEWEVVQKDVKLDKVFSDYPKNFCRMCGKAILPLL